MRRSASEIIRNLEMRIARLEKKSGVGFKTKKVKTNKWENPTYKVFSALGYEIGTITKSSTNNFTATPRCLVKDPRRSVQRKSFKTRKQAGEWLLKVRDLSYWDQRDAILSEFGRNSDEFRQIDNQQREIHR